MINADDFRQYAQECIESARVSESHAIRVNFLNMAKTWILAAAQIDDGLSSEGTGRRAPADVYPS
jgi:hypothetical protein